MSLKIERHIVRQHWMLEEATVSLVKALQGSVAEEEPQVLFVGGCVRNAVMDIPVDDIDMATPLMPDEVIQILEKENIKVIPTGIDHGTVTAVMNDRVFEITTLREDKETDGRRAQVDFTASWLRDAERRDFTINTLLMDLKGNVYDPLGLGLKDIDRQKVIFVGDPAQRIEEDYLRILRFFRFSAIYGQGEFDAQGLKACKVAADKIKTLSKERITQEFFKIVASEKAYEVLKVMFDNGVLRDLRFTDFETKFFEHFCNFQEKYRLNGLAARLYVFAQMDFQNVKAMEEYIIFPKVFLKDMHCISGSLSLTDLSCDHAVRESIYRFGRAMTAQALMMQLVQDRVMNAYAPKALEIIQNWDIPTFHITGDDLIAKGMKPGPELGEELMRLEEDWIKDGFT